MEQASMEYYDLLEFEKVNCIVHVNTLNKF